LILNELQVRGKRRKKAFPLLSTCPSGSKGFVKDTKEPDYSG